MSDRFSTAAKNYQNLDSTFKVSQFRSHGFGVQTKLVESTPASKAQLWENYQQTKQLNQKGANISALTTLPIQAKLTLGQPGDKYEQEADSVADRVMAIPEPLQVQREELEEKLRTSPLLLQRNELPENEDDLQTSPEDRTIQRVGLSAPAEPEFDAHPQALNSFFVATGTPLFKRINPQQCAFQTSFEVFASFNPRFKCSELEYRQFIRGHIKQERKGEVIADRGDLLSKLPSGRLWEVFQEDGNTASSPVHYGHRTEPADLKPNQKNFYTNAKGEVDLAKGCNFESSDTPFAFFDTQPGDIWDIELHFYGDIQQKGRSIQRRNWTAIAGKFVAPN
jgi:hypothetical protein